MFEQIVVVGAGRAGRPIGARLSERYDVRTSGRDLRTDDAGLVAVCTPDAAIEPVARAVEPGPSICHVIGATRLNELAPHVRRFSVHPLPTFQVDGGRKQLDGAYGAVTAATAEAAGRALAADLRLSAFALADADRPLYHAGATVAASLLATIQRAAAELIDRAGGPREALVSLMTRVVERGFQPTGPHVRGYNETIAAYHPEIGPLYDALSEATELLAAR